MPAASTQSGRCTNGSTAHRKAGMSTGFGFDGVTSTGRALVDVGHVIATRNRAKARHIAAGPKSPHSTTRGDYSLTRGKRILRRASEGCIIEHAPDGPPVGRFPPQPIGESKC